MDFITAPFTGDVQRICPNVVTVRAFLIFFTHCFAVFEVKQSSPIRWHGVGAVGQ